MIMTVQQFHEVQDLILRFWACVDEIAEIEGAALFTAKGALVIETFRAEGQEALRRYFTARRTLSVERQRSTRHLCTNLRQLPRAGVREGGVRMVATITVFSGTGPRPIALGAPSSLADFTFDCVETGQGWKFTCVSGALIFAGADTPDLQKAAAAAQGEST
ncbi:nuclear transport factor 2 family protein [Celeribacter baekdonensis]|uniref:nuclear transport factor 2 family protein n=1 Tax=Celeribacter baekdonensis TaxID=875171 RepID=UPI003A91D433